MHHINGYIFFELVEIFRIKKEMKDTVLLYEQSAHLVIDKTLRHNIVKDLFITYWIKCRYKFTETKNRYESFKDRWYLDYISLIKGATIKALNLIAQYTNL